MTGFSIDWLDLREEADRRARDSKLLARARDWLKDDRPPADDPLVVDLGAGTGATFRAFPQDDQNPLTWRLVDNDDALLAAARHRHGDRQRIETCQMDLGTVAALPLDDARLVTASALFDLTSPRFIFDLAARLWGRSQSSPVGLYAALSYDGTTRWTPAHPLDDQVLNAFNNDQHSDKGFGPALGPGATAFMQMVFSQIMSFTIYTASSPWILDGKDDQLVSALIEGIAAAIAQSPHIDATSLEDWTNFRRSQVAAGTCIVGHTDLLALPIPPMDRIASQSRES